MGTAVSTIWQVKRRPALLQQEAGDGKMPVPRSGVQGRPSSFSILRVEHSTVLQEQRHDIMCTSSGSLFEWRCADVGIERRAVVEEQFTARA